MDGRVRAGWSVGGRVRAGWLGGRSGSGWVVGFGLGGRLAVGFGGLVVASKESHVKEFILKVPVLFGNTFSGRGCKK